MEFVDLDAEAFRKFADKSPYKSFMQTPEIAKYRAQDGWTVYYFGVKKNRQLVAATMIVAKPTFLGKSTFRGYRIDSVFLQKTHRLHQVA